MKVLAGKRPLAVTVIASAAFVCMMSGTAVVAHGALQNGDKLIAKHTLSGNRLRNHTVTAQQIQALTWHALTLENGWAATTGDYASTPEYAKDAQGFVHFRGTISGSHQTSNTFAVLPAGYRPPTAHAWLALTGTNGDNTPEQIALDVVGATGDLTAYNAPSVNDEFISLEGAEFYAG
jgi:hypothetical protein